MFSLNTYDEGIVKKYLNKNSLFKRSINSINGLRPSLKNIGFFSPFLVLGNAFNNLNLEDKFIGFEIEDLVEKAMVSLYRLNNYTPIQIPTYITANSYDIDLSSKYEEYYKENDKFLNIFNNKFNKDKKIDICLSTLNNYIVIYTLVTNINLSKELYKLISSYQDALYLKVLEERIIKTVNRISCINDTISIKKERYNNDFDINIHYGYINDLIDDIREQLMLDR